MRSPLPAPRDSDCRYAITPLGPAPALALQLEGSALASRFPLLPRSSHFGRRRATTAASVRSGRREAEPGVVPLRETLDRSGRSGSDAPASPGAAATISSKGGTTSMPAGATLSAPDPSAGLPTPR